ncbi:MAG: PilZ domain-containing protein, partial [Spirochaetales bacterium]|nr:PilZ domain-containing protein [Spirochaetales bacterium]
MKLKEKRSEQRIDIKMFNEGLRTCRIRVDDSTAVIAAIENISLSGISICLPECIACFGRQKTTADISFLNEKYTLKVHVVYTVPADNGKTRTGIQFGSDPASLDFKDYILSEIKSIQAQSVEINTIREQHLKKRRKEKRYDADLLPDNMRKYQVHLSPEEEITVTVRNASMNGLGFISETGAEHFIIGSTIVLVPVGKSFTMYGKIIHVSALPQNRCMVGVELRHTVAMTSYQDILKKA